MEMCVNKCFKLYQIVINEKLSDLINKFDWGCHVTAQAYRNACDGDPSLGIANGCYTNTADLTCKDLDHCYEVGNIGPNEFINKRYSEGELAGVRSVSVGDLLEDEDGLLHLVDQIGFRNVTHLKKAQN